MARILALVMDLIMILQSALTFNVNDVFLLAYDKYSNLKYGTSTQQTVDLWIPKIHDGEVGLIMYIHGGSWAHGSKDSYDDKLSEFAQKGYACATMDYRLTSSGASAYDMLSDVTYALYKIKKTAEKDGVEINKVMLVGLSAGAHISLLYSYTRQNVAPITPVAVVAYCPPTNLYDNALYTKTCLGTKEQMAVTMSILCGEKFTYETKTNAYMSLAKISPYYYINADSVPTLLCHGKKDEAIPYTQSVRFVQRLDYFNVPHTFVSFPNSGHALNGDWEKTVIFNKYLDEYAFVYLN